VLYKTVNLIKFRDAIIFHRVMDLCSCTGRTFLISLQGELNLAYETYHTRILFFERYVGPTYANVFYFSVRVSSSLDIHHHACGGRTGVITAKPGMLPMLSMLVGLKLVSRKTSP